MSEPEGRTDRKLDDLWPQNDRTAIEHVGLSESGMSAPVAERITSPLVKPARDRRIPESSTCERPVLVRVVSMISRSAISLSGREPLNSASGSSDP